MLHMSVYLVADIDVHDPEMYEEYSRAARATFKGYGEVAYLVRGGEVTVLEGERRPKRFFIIRFEDKEKAVAWYNSPAYQETMKIREASATSDLFMVERVDWVVPGTESS
jgi:uncharacterized protein (DUF1330 family)